MTVDNIAPGVLEDFVTLPYGRVHYYTSGSGFPLVLIHGVNWGSWTWEKVVEPLAKEYHVYSFDLPGSQTSDRPQGWTKVQDFSEGIVAFMDALKIDQAHLVGRAAGAIFSIDIAVNHPQRVKKLVLNSSPGWNLEEGQKHFLVRHGQTPDRSAEPQTLEAVQKLIPEADQRILELYNNGRDSLEWIKSCHRATTLYDIPAHLPGVLAPTLLLEGEGDDTHGPHIRASRKALRSGIKNVSMATLPGTAYVPPFEQPEEFSRVVLDFLRDDK